MNKCNECGSQELKELFSGEVICKNCGLVTEEYSIVNQFISNTIKNHAQMPGLGSAGGRPINGRYVKDSWLRSTKEKNNILANKQIGLICEKMNLPKYVIQDAKLIFKRAMDKGLNIGRDNNSFVYSSIYASCNINSIPRVPLEFTINTSISKAKLLKVYNILKNKLNLEVKQVDITDLIHRFGNNLKLNHNAIGLACEIFEKLKTTSVLDGKYPQTIVAGLLYVSGKLNKDPRTQREIANVVGVLEVTIRKMSKIINKELNICK